MKTVRILLILLSMQAILHAGDSAYQALRFIGKDNQELLNHVITVQAANGQPQPAVWTITVEDQTARGGVRVYEASKSRIISEHTPVRSYAGSAANSVMDFKKLNLDSEGAFTVANQEASKRNVGFSSVDYLLRSDVQTGAPIWILKLIDVNHALVGTITIAAENGAVLNTTGFSSGVRPPPSTAYATPSGTVQLPPPPADGDEPPADQPPYGIGHQINKGFHRFGADLQQFFTGKRTWDQKFQNEP
jgi:hypothetical protein